MPASYFVSAVRAVFAATQLTCLNASILVIGPAAVPQVRALTAAFECAHVLSRDVYEDDSEPTEDPDATDDYDENDDVDDARRGHIFRDLELLALSDVMIGSNSEFSRLAQSMSAPDTIVLCAPWRPLSQMNPQPGLVCDATGVPNSIVTRLEKLPSNEQTHVDEPRVVARIAEAWQRRGGSDAGPIWARPRHGVVPFDFEQPVEVVHWSSDTEEVPAPSDSCAVDR